MKHQSKLIPIAAFLLGSTAFVHADMIIHDMGSRAADTLTALGTDFIIGCGILAAGVVAAAFISKKR